VWRHGGVPALAVSAVAAATAAAVLVPMTAIGSASGHHRAVVPAPVVPTDDQMVGFHGVVLTVPGSWHINDARCGTPVADTVIRDEGSTPLCLVPRPKGVSSVELLADPASWTAQLRQASAMTNAHGVHLRRGAVSGRGDAVVVPAVGVVLFVQTPSAKTAQRIIDSVQVVDTDTTGCAMRQSTLNPPPGPALRGAPFRHYNVRYVIPPQVASIAVCHYIDGWLASSTTVTGAPLADLVHRADSPPAGFAPAPGSDYLPNACRSGFVLQAHYDGQPDLLLWAHVGSCGLLGITNGLRSAPLTPALARAITSPLHIGG